MTVERYIRIFAGIFIMVSLALGVEESPVFVSHWALAFTAFVGLNLFQFGLTNFCPMAIKADPMPIRGATAFSKIRRISASVLLPCWAARNFKARCVASGRFLTVTADMENSPCYGFG
jgi:hypothetical protein